MNMNRIIKAAAILYMLFPFQVALAGWRGWPDERVRYTGYIINWSRVWLFFESGGSTVPEKSVISDAKFSHPQLPWQFMNIALGFSLDENISITA
ncbi:MAG: hypothetical protein GDA38_14250 [Hormoscilla sp. SP12CHS1]|nr:hypothetical protein [Hormoscilla sp. SP12CHS1]